MSNCKPRAESAITTDATKDAQSSGNRRMVGTKNHASCSSKNNARLLRVLAAYHTDDIILTCASLRIISAHFSGAANCKRILSRLINIFVLLIRSVAVQGTIAARCVRPRECK